MPGKWGQYPICNISQPNRVEKNNLTSQKSITKNRENRLDVKSSFHNRDLCPDIFVFTFPALILRVNYILPLFLQMRLNITTCMKKSFVQKGKKWNLTYISRLLTSHSSKTASNIIWIQATLNPLLKIGKIEMNIK